MQAPEEFMRGVAPWDIVMLFVISEAWLYAEKVKKVVVVFGRLCKLGWVE